MIVEWSPDCCGARRGRRTPGMILEDRTSWHCACGQPQGSNSRSQHARGGHATKWGRDSALHHCPGTVPPGWSSFMTAMVSLNTLPISGIWIAAVPLLIRRPNSFSICCQEAASSEGFPKLPLAKRAHLRRYRISVCITQYYANLVSIPPECSPPADPPAQATDTSSIGAILARDLAP